MAALLQFFDGARANTAENQASPRGSGMPVATR